VNDEDELEYIENQTVFSSAAPQIGNTVLTSILDEQFNRIVDITKDRDNPLFAVYNSTRKSVIFDKENVAKLFPHLFPFGTGHPGQYRKIKVSRQECITYYLHLSGRQFDRDSLFILYAFDSLSLDRSLSQANFNMTSKSKYFKKYGDITRDHLENALKNKVRTNNGRNPIQTSTEEEKVVLSFLKNIKMNSANLWGSNEERNVCREEAFATAERFGQPTIFCTITPNTDCSLTLAYLAGQLNIDSLFEIDFSKHNLSKIKLEKMAAQSNVSAAKLYDYSINTFLEIAIGIIIFYLHIHVYFLNVTFIFRLWYWQTRSFWILYSILWNDRSARWWSTTPSCIILDCRCSYNNNGNN
jgi:hypothetical protein